MFGSREIIGFGSTEFYIKEMDRNKAIEIIVKNHYSKKVFNNSYIHLGCYINNELLGVLQFGHLLNNLSVGTLVEGTNAGEALELNRMWFDDKAERNSESKALSYCIKYIRSKFKSIQRRFFKYFPNYRISISYRKTSEGVAFRNKYISSRQR